MTEVQSQTSGIYKKDTPKRKHILLADDEGPLRRSIKLILRQAGYKVTALADGNMALKTVLDLRCTTEAVDLVMTDLHMGGLNGIELIQALRDHGVQVPVLVITGYGNKDTVIQLLRLGCADYADKPLNPADILRRIDRILKRQAEADTEIQEKAEMKIEQRRLLDQTLQSYQERVRQLSGELDRGELDYHDMLTPRTRDLCLRVAYHNRPVTDQGGAFIDIQNTPAGCDLFMANVPGVDKNASYHNLLMKAFFEETCRQGYPGDSFLQLLNRQLRESELAGRPATALFMRVNLADLTAGVISADHPAPIRIRRNIPVPNHMTTSGDPLGIQNHISFDNRSFKLSPGDRIFLFSDAVLASAGRLQPPREWMEQIILEPRDSSLKEQTNVIWDRIIAQSTSVPPGNLLLVGLEIPDERFLRE